MGRFREKCDYESVRNARISENKARMESLGLNRKSQELNQIISPKSTKTNNSNPKRTPRKIESTPIRRSSRLKSIYSSENKSNSSSTRRSLTFDSNDDDDSSPKGSVDMDPDKRARLSRRCDSKGRGSIYDPILGICCHFCRQKKLCGEEDCMRCGDGDPDKPCTGKTECSVCHSSNGVLCRACLKVRYGEEMEEVRRNNEWMCPHCIEEKGIKPFWICNSSFCLKKRKITPTGIAIYQARQQGFKSVAHLIMDQLKNQTTPKIEDD
ncbi:hypothetical protein LUZ60_005476 [Juncus effusus]|nr:hypothetical protein LUZ60_005476 [Juncus effusus]